MTQPLTAHQMKAACQVTAAVMQINNAGVAYADMYLTGDHGNSLHITVLPLDRPVDLEAQKASALFDRYIDLDSSSASSDLSDSLKTLNAFLLDEAAA